MRRDPELRLACTHGSCHHGRLAALLALLAEADRGLKHQENVIAGGLDVGNGIGDGLRLRERLIDGVS